MSIIYINVVICSSFPRVVNMSTSRHMDHMLEPNKIDNQVFVVLKLYLKSFEPSWNGLVNRDSEYMYFFLGSLLKYKF